MSHAGQIVLSHSASVMSAVVLVPVAPASMAARASRAAWRALFLVG
jgi:hypothetical protein